MGSYAIRTLLLGLISVIFFGLAVGTAAATEVNGRMLLGAYSPVAAKPKRAPFNWELENGFKEVRPDRVDAARELAVVLVGAGDPAAVEAMQRTETLFSGGGLLPSTVVARTGATLLIRNEDEVAHEVYAEKLDTFIAEAISPLGRRTVKLAASGNWALRDKLIPHVSGHLIVLDDLVAVGKVDEGGRFTFADVAPGSYTLKVFHGPKEVGSAPVEVATKTLTLDPLTLTAEAEPTDGEPAGGEEDAEESE